MKTFCIQETQVGQLPKLDTTFVVIERHAKKADGCLPGRIEKKADCFYPTAIGECLKLKEMLDIQESNAAITLFPLDNLNVCSQSRHILRPRTEIYTPYDEPRGIRKVCVFQKALKGFMTKPPTSSWFLTAGKCGGQEPIHIG